MRIAPYYQKLLKDAVQAAKSLEPITFVGMFGSGTSYLFNLAVPLFAAELPKSVQSIPVDLSGVTTGDDTRREIQFSLARSLKTKIQATDFFDLTGIVEEFARSKKVLFVLYLGQEGYINQEFLLFLNRLRNVLGWKFSYVLYASARCFTQKEAGSAIANKVVKRNVVPILPLADSDARVVLANYEERYHASLSEQRRKIILEASGGNPGLIKALYLQIKADPAWKKINPVEDQLYFRIKGTCDDLTDETKAVLLGKKRTTDPMTEYFLTRYGYAQKKSGRLEVFSPLVVDFLRHWQSQSPLPQTGKYEQPIDEELLHFTQVQRKVLAYLRERAGQLVTRDDLAKVLWGDGWADRYSDWAIDQLISTLREKMGLAKQKANIVTKKGEGILYIPDSGR